MVRSVKMFLRPAFSVCVFIRPLGPHVHLFRQVWNGNKDFIAWSFSCRTIRLYRRLDFLFQRQTVTGVELAVIEGAARKSKLKTPQTCHRITIPSSVSLSWYTGANAIQE